MIESDLKDHFDCYSSILKEESTGKVLPTIGRWPSHRLVEFSSAHSSECNLSDHVTVVRKNDSWHVVWVDHMARTSVIDSDIDPFNTLCEAFCAAFNYNKSWSDKGQKYEGADLAQIIPNDRWLREVRMRQNVWNYGIKGPGSHKKIIINFEYALNEHLNLTPGLSQAMGNFARGEFLSFIEEVVRFSRCSQRPSICFQSDEFDDILALTAEYYYSIRDNHAQLESVYRSFVNSLDDNELKGVDALKELLSNHKASEKNIEIALELARLVKKKWRVRYLIEQIENGQKKKTSDVIPVGSKPTRLMTSAQKNLCFDTFQALGSALPEEHLEAFCACAFFGEGNLDELLENSGEFIRHNEDCVEAHIFQTLGFSSAEKESFWSGVETGSRQYSRTEFAKSCANGISTIPRNEAVELCGCVYDKAKGRGIRLEALSGQIGAELGADCAQSLGIKL